jgi:organic radical activating enzyme
MAELKRVINVIVPVTACNMRCGYCYVSQMGANSGEIKNLPFDVKTIAKALSAKRLGGTCLLQLCGNGETLLPPYIVELSRLLLEDGHYIFITTNGVLTNKIDAFLQFPLELKKRLGFKFSYHYLELERLGKSDVFFENAKKIRAAGSSVDIEAGAFDDYADCIEEMKALSFRHMGAYAHVADIHSGEPYFKRLTKRPLDEHFKTWDSFESPAFALQKKLWMKPIKDFCYGGDWFFQLYLEDGKMQPCIGGGNFIGNIYDDINAPVHFAALGKNCICPYCYGAHCYLAIGMVPDIPTTHYDEIRNRVLADGSQWLTSELRDIMHCKLYESNKEYSDDKKTYISALMAEEYNSKKYLYSREEVGSLIERSLTAGGIQRIGIYGIGKFTTWLIDVLKNTSIDILFIADDSQPLNSDSYLDRFKNQFAFTLRRMQTQKDSPVTLNIAHKWPKVDALVVTEYPRYEALKAYLIVQKASINTIPITELIA